MTSMYGPNRSHYGDYSNYWGGYGRPPHPPPPPPPNDFNYHPPPPPPPHYRPIRPPTPHSLHPPPPPPPPIRPPRPPQYRQYKSSATSTNGTAQPKKTAGGESTAEPSAMEAETATTTGTTTTTTSTATTPAKPKEPMVGTPLVPRRSEPEPPPPTSKPSVPNNKRPLPVEFDPNLPEDLVAKFFNNKCDLCEVKLNSRIQAKNHYEGKLHRKKVKNFIIENSRKDGESPSKMPKIDLSTPKKKVEPLDVSQLYCKCCDLCFTSEQHAQQHYMGRNHQRILHGLKPLKAGYFNKETGKWQRMPPDPRVSVERIGFNLPVSAETEDAPKAALDPEAVKERGRFYCEMCQVSATSQDQLDGHMAGQRHLKALRLKNAKTSPSSSSSSAFRRGQSMLKKWKKRKQEKGQPDPAAVQ